MLVFLFIKLNTPNSTLSYNYSLLSLTPSSFSRSSQDLASRLLIIFLSNYSCKVETFACASRALFHLFSDIYCSFFVVNQQQQNLAGHRRGGNVTLLPSFLLPFPFFLLFFLPSFLLNIIFHKLKEINFMFISYEDNFNSKFLYLLF